MNVVIHRLPLGMSVNDPRRSFCPSCKNPIPVWRNIPLLSWLWLRGKCADCKAPIAFRYFAVELLTALLFAGVWWFLQSTVPLGALVKPELAALLPLWTMAGVFVAITVIDAEHQIIPPALSWTLAAAGLAAAALWPMLPDLAGWSGVNLSRAEGLRQSAIGGVIGFCGLWSVVLFGKMAFGRKRMESAEPVEWRLIEPENDEDPIFFEMGGESTGWWDIFYRKSDRLRVEATELRVNDEERDAGTVMIREQGVELPDGEFVPLEDLKSLEGRAILAVIPREAMGMGDVHLMGGIGLFFGWTGVLFTLFASSVFGVIAALLGRIGFGMRLPFGPFLILGALAWMFGGWRLAEWYFSTLAGFGR